MDSPAPRDAVVSVARPVYIFNAPMPELVGSVPLQALIPARNIGAKALYFEPEMDAESFLDRHQPKILIFTKLFDEAPLALAAAASRRGIKLVGVFCDFDASVAARIDTNRKLCDLIVAAVAPTLSMARLVEQHYGKPCVVIEEPVEYHRRKPGFAPGHPLKVLWIGHRTNHDTLEPGLRSLGTIRSRPIHMMIVSGDMPDFGVLKGIAPNISLSYLPWSPLIQYEVLGSCDLVFIPSLDNPSKHAKGQARLITAIQSGRIAVAHPLPQYEELADFCYCTRDYAEGVETALANPSDAMRRVDAGQRYIDQRFSQEACADKWLKLISDVFSG